MSDDLVYVPPVVPLFPLPGVVLFPSTIIQLHVFEPRYRELTADALAGEGVIAVALLKPGFEPLYHTRAAPIHATIGVGQIVESQKEDNGDYALLLRGVGRAVVLEEMDERTYRLARIEPLETYCRAQSDEVKALRTEVCRAIRHNGALEPKMRAGWLRLCKMPLDLGDLADVLSAGLPAEAELRQCLLDEPDEFARAQMVLSHLRAIGEIANNQRRATTIGDCGLN